MSNEQSDSPPIVAIQQGAIADYRVGFYHILQQRYPAKLRLYAGETDFSASIRTTQAIRDNVRFLNNYFFLNRRLLWQGKRFRERVKVDVLILNFNLRIVSHYPLMVLRWILRRPTLLWGHVKGQSKLAERYGFIQLFFAKGFICYTNSQQRLFHQLHPKLNIRTFVASNSCLAQADCYALDRPLSTINDVVCVGRLVKYKKVHLLIKGFLLAKQAHKLTPQARLVLVGSGPLESSLREIVEESKYSSSIIFKGHISNLDRLREIYSTAFCSVSPGALGLTAVQTFAFGVPLLVARNEPHGPEIEICNDLHFGEFFESDSPESIAKSLERAWQSREGFLKRRAYVIQHVKKNYTFEKMADAFQEAICRSQ